MIRKKLIAGNWKMNKTAADGAALTTELLAAIGRETAVDVVLCPPFTALESVGRALEGQALKLGAQNMHPEKNGAFTGEVSAEMLRSLFVSYVILGHSERRMMFGDTDAFVNKKTLTALANQLKPILCVGETLAEREGGTTLAVVKKQLEGGLIGVTAEQMASVVIAYEPVWAIGTGKTASPAQAQEAHLFIRAQLKKIHGDGFAAGTRILYGGSVTAENVDQLMAQADVDGALVGGASLKKDFLRIMGFQKA